MRLEHRQIDIRQNPSMLELIQVHVDCAQIIDPAHRCLYHVALREGQHGPTITEMSRGVSALCGAPNWLSAESVSGTLSWMPFATLVRHVDPHTRQYPTTAALLL